jgi:pyruvate dehydrogenase (quinone)/pyruvate oxidase
MFARRTGGQLSGDCAPGARRPVNTQQEVSVVAQLFSEALIQRLAEWGVDTVFGLPGDGINGILEGLRRNQDKVRFVLVHHEEAAAFMATGYAKATGRLGVCLATSGPGGIHLLNGLYDAKLDHMPVLAITGMQETSVLGTGYQQEVPLDRLYADVAEYDQMIYNPAQLPGVLDLAIRTAYARRGVAHITVPNDIQVADADADPWQHVAPARPPKTAPIRLPAPGRPREEDLQRLADFLNDGKKIAILAGAGARHAREELLALAETLGAPIVKTLSGKATVPDDSPYTTGGIGLLGTRPSEDLMDEIDTLFMVGTNFPYTKHLPPPGKVRVAQIEADPARAGGRIATELPVVGDAKEGLAGLLPLLKHRGETRLLKKYQKEMADWRKKMAAQEDAGRNPIAPQYVVAVLDELAAEDAVLTCDSGTIATWAARHWMIRGGREFYLSGNLATMAPGMPYAIGIQHAFPGRQVIGYVGDGGFSMLMAEFITAIQHRLPVKIVINNNNSLGQILWEQMVLGFPEHGVRYPQPFVNYAALAEANGALGIKVEQAGDVRGAVQRILAHSGPALLDVNVNPDEPPLPGKVEYDQAKKFAEAFLRGQPHKATIASTLFRDKINELKP